MPENLLPIYFFLLLIFLLQNLNIMGCYSKENDMISESVDSAIHEKLSKPLFYVSIWEL